MKAKEVAAKLAADINALDHSYWLRVGQGRISVGEYFRERRRLAKSLTRTDGFMSVQAYQDDGPWNDPSF